MQPTNRMQTRALTKGTQAFSLQLSFQNKITDSMFPQSTSRRSLTDSDDMYLDNFEDYGLPSFMFLYVLVS